MATEGGSIKTDKGGAKKIGDIRLVTLPLEAGTLIGVYKGADNVDGVVSKAALPVLMIGGILSKIENSSPCVALFVTLGVTFLGDGVVWSIMEEECGK